MSYAFKVIGLLTLYLQNCAAEREAGWLQFNMIGYLKGILFLVASVFDYLPFFIGRMLEGIGPCVKGFYYAGSTVWGGLLMRLFKVEGGLLGVRALWLSMKQGRVSGMTAVRIQMPLLAAIFIAFFGGALALIYLPFLFSDKMLPNAS